MKLATYQDGSRDGQLVVVSRDLSTAHHASAIASRLQAVLDDWNFLAPQLQDLYETLNGGKARHAFAFEPARCLAPLPRAYQRAAGSAYLHSVELACKARGTEMPESFATHPPMVQGASDDLLGPREPIVRGSEDAGIDFGGEVAVITGDVAMGVDADAALDAVRLVTLANAVSLRHLFPPELAIGFGFVPSQPATAFAPVAATPDELGEAWQGGRVHLSLQTDWNGRTVGLCEAGLDMTFHFGQLTAHLAKTRRLRAGSIVGGGTVSNRDASHGYGCIAEKRALETIESGAPSTGFLQFGDTVRIDMKGRDGQSVFGSIEQTVARAGAA